MIQSAFDNETTRNGLGIPGDDDLPSPRPIRIRGILGACLVVLGLWCDWAAGGETNDIYGRHVAGLKQKAPPGFTVVEQRPFVVVGDEPPEVVRLRATRTVQWAVDALKREYFARDPEETIDIWLFKDKASYERYVRGLFQDQPATPFGYYSSVHHALVMNISTGCSTKCIRLCPIIEPNSQTVNWRIPTLFQGTTRRTPDHV
jgi:hypothetical protein